MNDQKKAPRQLMECPEGTLTPREMVGYLRTMLAQGEPPERVSEHLTGCRACQANWRFLKRTDPVAQKWRAERVALVMRQVLDEEELEAPNIVLPKGELIEKVESLVRPPDWLDSTLKDILVQPSPLPAQAFEICNQVRAIVPDRDRFLAAERVASVFESRGAKRPEFGSLDFFMVPERAKIQVQGWEIEFAASLPQTSYFQDPALLVRDDDGIIFFHREEYQKRIPEFNEVRRRFA